MKEIWVRRPYKIDGKCGLTCSYCKRIPFKKSDEAYQHVRSCVDCPVPAFKLKEQRLVFNKKEKVYECMLCDESARFTGKQKNNVVIHIEKVHAIKRIESKLEVIKNKQVNEISAADRLKTVNKASPIPNVVDKKTDRANDDRDLHFVEVINKMKCEFQEKIAGLEERIKKQSEEHNKMECSTNEQIVKSAEQNKIQSEEIKKLKSEIKSLTEQIKQHDTKQQLAHGDVEKQMGAEKTSTVLRTSQISTPQKCSSSTLSLSNSCTENDLTLSTQPCEHVVPDMPASQNNRASPNIPSASYVSQSPHNPASNVSEMSNRSHSPSDALDIDISGSQAFSSDGQDSYSSDESEIIDNNNSSKKYQNRTIDISSSSSESEDTTDRPKKSTGHLQRRTLTAKPNTESQSQTG